MLCVGLDPEPTRFPAGIKGDANKIYDFCAAIVDATADLAIAFKPQIAYFAAHRAEDQLERLMAHMRAWRRGAHHPGRQARRHRQHRRAVRHRGLRALRRRRGHAVALHGLRLGGEPYLVLGKGAFLLCRTSNPGGDDLQNQRLAGRRASRCCTSTWPRLAQGPWNLNGQLGLVVGATYPQEIERVRALAPTLPLLIPGVGAQGGDAAATVQAGPTRPTT
jgi:orotidine-5'-phosphate decarboxylase